MRPAEDDRWVAPSGGGVASFHPSFWLAAALAACSGIVSDEEPAALSPAVVPPETSKESVVLGVLKCGIEAVRRLAEACSTATARFPLHARVCAVR